jgi:hypothetical protein
MHFEVENTYERRYAPVKFDHTLYKDDQSCMSIGTEYFQQRYLLTLTVRTEFWSNSAQLDSKRKLAEDLVCAYLYKDMIPIVKGIMLEANSEQVYKLAGDLLQMMGKNR